jgi:diacylglycerol kinase
MSNASSRPWLAKLADAFRGVITGVRREFNLRIHFAAAFASLGLAAWLGCDRMEWCLLVGCIGLVMAAELLNSALEAIFHGLDDAAKSRISGCLDLAAGAVLVASATSAVVGGLILIPRVWALR